MDNKYSYGWRPSLPDTRDYKFSLKSSTPLPNYLDLRNRLSGYNFPVYDQGALGSCTANAAAGLYQMIQGLNKKPKGTQYFTPSRLFIYYNTRAIEGTIRFDSGATCRDTLKAVRTTGCPKEALWPYNIKRYKTRPSQRTYNDGKKHRITKYSSVNNSSLANVQHALALGYPIVAGFTVFQSFESDAVANTGIVPMPGQHERVLGGHAVLIVGYDNANQWFIVRNSWGPNWGDRGYFYAPYAYFTNRQLASDFWTASATTIPKKKKKANKGKKIQKTKKTKRTNRIKNRLNKIIGTKKTKKLKRAKNKINRIKRKSKLQRIKRRKNTSKTSTKKNR